MPRDNEPKVLPGKNLRELRLLSGFSRSGLELCADLSRGRLAVVESGRGMLHDWERDAIRKLLREELKHRAKEIACALSRGLDSSL